jgi:hypothetical protein
MLLRWVRRVVHHACIRKAAWIEIKRVKEHSHCWARPRRLTSGNQEPRTDAKCSKQKAVRARGQKRRHRFPTTALGLRSACVCCIHHTSDPELAVQGKDPLDARRGSETPFCTCVLRL